MPTRRGTLLLCLLAAGVHGQDVRTSSVFEGTVLDSVTRRPVVKASMQLKPENGAAYVTTTGPDGSFRFESLPPGDYALEITHRGYADGHTVALKPGQTSADLHFVAGQDLTGAVSALDPDAILTGRVMDANGDPVESAMVIPLVDGWTRGERLYQPEGFADADDRGQYRLALRPGSYRLMASPANSAIRPAVFTVDPGGPEKKLGTVYYPNSADATSSQAIELRPGQHLDGIDFQLPLRSVFHVRGTVKPYAAASDPRAPNLALGRRGGGMRGRAAAATAVATDGSFDIAGVEPGSYWLELQPFAGVPTGRTQIDVADRDVDGVRLTSMQQFQVEGTVRFENGSGERRVPQVNLRLEMVDWFQFRSAGSISVHNDGGLASTALMCGTYYLNVDPMDGVYLKSATYAGRDIPNGRIDLTGGPAGKLDLVLASGPGEVAGSVRWPDVRPGEPPSLPGGAVFVVVVSTDGPTGNTGARVQPVGSDGRFRVRWVAPGRYVVFATTQGDSGLWQNHEIVSFLSGSGVAAEVPEQGSVQVEAPLLSANELRRALQQVAR